uniref:ACB domain-containing protein n=1 Tax=Macrostomum lignano TaxID=282301 RepID=A0A1I8G6G1_9PLAT
MHYLGESSFNLDELYLLCVRFIKEKEGKAFHLSYQDRLQLAAHCKQVAHGPYKSDASPGVGWLDVVGSDRKATWQSLGDLSRERAQEKFVEILDRACPLLAPYLEAHLNEKRDRENKIKEEAEAKEREIQRQKQQEQEQMQQQQRKQAEAAAKQNLANQKTNSVSGPVTNRDDSRRHQQEAQIRAALNQQTAVQFRQYAAEQHPGDANKQAELIAQLQEQHFQQYMTQVYQQQLKIQQEEEQAKLLQQQPKQSQQNSTNESATVEAAAAEDFNQQLQQQLQQDGDDEAEAGPEILPASMWTRNNAAEFKKEILRDSRHCCIKIGSLATATPQSPSGEAATTNSLMAAPSMWCDKQLTAAQFKAKLAADSDARLKIGPGEVVTVRVPTHEEGSCIVWEFATDHYDIGFGVYFEWTISPSDRVTVHISESSDEEEEEEAKDDGNNETGEAEHQQLDGDSKPADGAASKRRRPDDDKAVDEIIPVFRRDCHEEVYCGSHQYPGRGVYLLKFDNSYSLWRSKWLYYRVYYTK